MKPHKQGFWGISFQERDSIGVELSWRDVPDVVPVSSLSRLLQVVVLITDGKSSDPVEEGAQILQDGGVTVFAVGTWGHQNPLCDQPPSFSSLQNIPEYSQHPLPKNCSHPQPVEAT